MGVEERLERIERLLLLGSKEVLNTSEIALLLGISESRVRHLTSAKKIPHYKQAVGGQDQEPDGFHAPAARKIGNHLP